LNVDSLRKIKVDEVSTYGDQEIDKLVCFYGYESCNNYGETFSRYIEPVKTVAQWKVFKNWARMDCLHLSQTQLIKYMRLNTNQEFSEIIKLMITAEITPVSTACCERGFSKIDNTKKLLRTMLGIILI
jgi:hypothetical protein